MFKKAKSPQLTDFLPLAEAHQDSSNDAVHCWCQQTILVLLAIRLLGFGPSCSSIGCLIHRKPPGAA